MDRFKYLRPTKARIAKGFYDTLEDKTGKLKVQTYSNCTIIPDYISRVETQEESCIQLSEFGGGGPFLSSKNIGKSRHFEGTTLYGGVYHPMWGHYLVNSLERLWYNFSKEAPLIDHIVFVSDNITSTQMGGGIATLNKLAEISDKLVVTNCITSFDELIVPDQALSHRHYSKEFMWIFEKVKKNALVNDEHFNYPEKIFLTRSNLKNAHKNEINCELLDKYFVDNGYQILSPERMSLTELIRYFHHAKSIVSICGTLAHNFLFAPQTAKFTIIERHGFINEWQMTCDRAAGICSILVDANYQPMQSNSIGRLFLYSGTPQFESWIEDNGMKPHNFPIDEFSRQKEIRRYIKRYRQLYGYAPFYWPYDEKLGEVYVEAILEAGKVYGKWMRRQAPVFFGDYFDLKCHQDLRFKLSQLYHRLLRK